MRTELTDMELAAQAEERAEARRVAEDMALEHGADGVSFDDAGRPVAVTLPVTSTEAQAEDPVAEARLSAIGALLDLLTADRDRPEQVGRTIYLLQFALGRGDRFGCASQRSLAAWLRVSESRLSDMLRAVRRRAHLLSTTCDK